MKLFPFSIRAAGVALMALALGLALAGCKGSEAGGETRFPAYAYNSAITLEGYRAAVRVPELLPSIPCYCGCGVSQGHTSLKDCFFNSDGSFADHASNCHVCAEEAVAVGKWRDEGLPLKEIRSRIEQEFSPFGPGTPTPPLQ